MRVPTDLILNLNGFLHIIPILINRNNDASSKIHKKKIMFLLDSHAKQQTEIAGSQFQVIGQMNNY